MTTKEMMEALLAGKTLIHVGTKNEIGLSADGNHLIQYDGVNFLDNVFLPPTSDKWRIKPQKRTVWVRWNGTDYEFYPFVFHSEQDATSSGTYKAYPVEIEVD
jgi:hypothetical protein